MADALDTMITPRTYRAPLTHEQAIEELRESAAHQFCPRCVPALLPVPGLAP